MHAWQWEEGAQPDLQVVGKGLGGGYAPISAILIAKDVVNAFRSGSGAFNNGETGRILFLIDDNIAVD